MNNVGLSEHGNQHAKDHLIPLAPGEIRWIDHGARSIRFGAGIGDDLGRRQR
jgi:hypothetical protein